MPMIITVENLIDILNQAIEKDSNVRNMRITDVDCASYTGNCTGLNADEKLISLKFYLENKEGTLFYTIPVCEKKIEKHTVIEGCLVKYGVPSLDGKVFKHGSLHGCDGLKIPVTDVFNHDVDHVIGYAILIEHPEGIWYRCVLNDSPKSVEIQNKINKQDWTLGYCINKIKYDPDNRNNIIDGAVRAASFVKKCDDSSWIDTILIPDSEKEDVDDECRN